VRKRREANLFWTQFQTRLTFCWNVAFETDRNGVPKTQQWNALSWNVAHVSARVEEGDSRCGAAIYLSPLRDGWVIVAAQHIGLIKLFSPCWNHWPLQRVPWSRNRLSATARSVKCAVSLCFRGFLQSLHADVGTLLKTSRGRSAVRHPWSS
jgi:hypothetical protein